MENHSFEICASRLEAYLKKPARRFTKADIMQIVRDFDIEMVKFMYPAGDGRLKTLNFMINSVDYLETILTCGERVDGSSLFSFIQAGSSDLYVMPRFATAFIDPFEEIPTLNFLCSYFNRDGQPLESAPEYTLKKAMKAFTKVTGMEFQAMGELEYYVIRDEEEAFAATDQKGYHESAPFAKANEFRARCMKLIAECGGQIKYGHSEVGTFFEGGRCFEQNEVEFLPVAADECADQLLLAKWIIRNLGYQEGLDITFAPKITVGKAGSGMHIHMRIMKDGRNLMLDGGKISDDARKAIAGMMDLAESITAFGNKNPTSYFRLVPHQEAPTNICWGMSNRSVLVRVPLGWTSGVDMCHLANPQEPETDRDYSSKQTVEMRSPDASADVYQLLAGLCVACRHGFEMPNALEVADLTFADGDIHDPKNAERYAKLAQLPDSCEASADCLERQRKVYEEYDVFSPAMIDGIIAQLRAQKDRTLRQELQGNEKALFELVKKFYHCG
ncbi:MAG: glutamine synthetase family protein [Prevotella sp.]|nr:glutamine synthetase family protein [Prevotella sp.]MDD7273441.1 glutamine synthetase family protein [Prevotellaceae bacterium]MDY3935891.1 glutamine synthetase family protein [Prevotella sp.]MDY4218199.1 glutamine synthetase family protein [Prevotella sp.]